MTLIEPDNRDHLEDTNPIQPIRDEPLPRWRRIIGAVSLLGALILTIGSTVLLLSPPTETPVITPQPTTVLENPTLVPPTLTPQVGDAAPVSDVPVSAAVPTLTSDQIMAILSQPPAEAEADSASYRIVRDNYDPFTIIPDRPRTEVIPYEIVEGDTVFAIAERFGLAPETIAWSNDRATIMSLRAGRTINIPPVDGVFHEVIGSRTIAQIAADYGIADPYVVIDSEYNNLFGVSPDTVLPSGTDIMIPGGEAEQISWNPRVEREGGDEQSGGNFVSFAPGEAGSCGRVQNVGGTFWSSPIDSYSFVQGYSSFHTGVDLSAVTGTPVKAANGGVVIFAGWNSFGYGSTIVLSHGPFTTLYGHLSGINVGCGQVVSAGQVIGAVGSTGNSSGPHLHFEIRYLDVPQNPTATLPF